MENIFTKIINGEIPSHKVYEDDRFIAILDINPQSKGHTLIIPKRFSRDLFDLREDDAREILLVAQKVGRAIMEAFKADGLNANQNSGEVAGQIVMHYHLHLIPRYKHLPKDNGDLEVTAKKIKLALKA